MADETDLEIIKNYINMKMRVGKLDSALLFLSSSLGLIFGLLQDYLGGIKAIFYFLPLVFLGWIFPFYIGYIEGAILRDSAVIRSKGWIYLSVGTLIYFSSLIHEIIPKFLPEGLVYLIVRGILTFTPIFPAFFAAKWQYKLTKKIFDICNTKASEVDLRATYLAGFAASLFSLSGFFFITASGLGVQIVALIIFFLGCFIEYSSRFYVNQIGKPFKTIKKKGRPKLGYLGLLILAGGAISSGVITNMSIDLQRELSILSLFIVFIGAFIFIIFSPQEEIRFE